MPKKNTPTKSKSPNASRARQYVDNQTCWRSWASNGLPPVSAFNAYLDADARATLVELRDDLDNRFWSGQDPVRAVEGFLADFDDVVGYRDRYATIRLFEKVSGMSVRALQRSQPLTKGQIRRPLTPLEMTLLRRCSTASLQKVGLIGVCEAGAGSGELHPIVGTDITLDSSGRGTHLDARGTDRPTKSGYPVCMPRRLQIPVWCQEVIGGSAKVMPNSPLLYGGNAEDETDRQSAVLMVVKSVFDDAGLGQDKTVAPLSIRNTTAKRVNETAGLQAAAALLGIGNFQFVAYEIELSPRP